MIKDLIDISQAVAERHDFIQGGGGNTSVKSAEGEMAIKASGYELRAVSENDSFAILCYQDYINLLADSEIATSEDPDKLLNEKGKATLVPFQGKTLRPSMETGFHAILKKYVIHTHSVYSNLINCAEKSGQLLAECFKGTELKPAFVKYINPGYYLCLEIQRVKNEYSLANGSEPEVYFLQNHGVIVTSHSKSDCIALHGRITEIIEEYFKPAAYPPKTKLKEVAENHFVSSSEFLKSEILSTAETSAEFFEANVMFPDQTVFFDGNIYVGEGSQPGKKININPITGAISYFTNQKEARTIEETLLAYLYIRKSILSSGNMVRYISEQERSYLNNMESEKFRKSLLNK